MGRFVIVAVFAVYLVAVVAADLRSATEGDCVCATTNVNARSRDGLSGSVALTIRSGQCAIYIGVYSLVDNNRSHMVVYNRQTLWVVGTYFSVSPLSNCSSTTSGGSCRRVQQLACNLWNNANLTLASAHASGRSDNAFARNNLRDICDGRKAARSSYNCSECRNPGAPGGSVCIAGRVLRYLAALVARGRVKVNEIAGACHSCSSKHYQGLAIDLDDGPRDQEFITTCNNRGGRGIDEGNHIHCQFNRYRIQRRLTV